MILARLALMIPIRHASLTTSLLLFLSEYNVRRLTCLDSDKHDLVISTFYSLIPHIGESQLIITRLIDACNGNDYCFQSEPRRDGTNLIRAIYYIHEGPKHIALLLIYCRTLYEFLLELISSSYQPSTGPLVSRKHIGKSV
jgi:hypothetical protein